jgi:dTDP-4-dehydrorhamnose 3,5-epimerase
MKIDKMSISGAWQVYSPVMMDNRGAFKEWFKQPESLEQTGAVFNVSQSNVSKSKKGVIRGIHYSLNPAGQWKWISCVSGSILDVVVDIRIDSPTFGNFEEVELNGSNGKSILIQGNLGHAFQSLSEDAIVVYNINSVYMPEYEKDINPLDKFLNIRWPIFPQILSEKDSKALNLQDKLKLGELPYA